MLQVLENDVVRLMVVSVIQIALCYPMKNIQNIRFKLWYSIALGTLLQVIVYGWQAFYILLFSITMYLLTLILPLKRVGWAVTAISMIFLSYYHLESLIHRYGEYVFDETVLLMIMVCKCSLYAYAWQDGQLKLENPNKQNGLQNRSEREKEKEKQREKYYISTRVNLLDYIGYIQFLPTSIMGPPIQYKIYQKYIKNQGQFGQPLPSRKQKIVSTGKQFVICFILFVIGTIYFSTDFVKTEQFYSYNRLSMFFYTAIASTLLRFKYYSGWKIGIASIHASGVSYDAKTKDYTAIEHCRPLIIETSPTIRDKINNWNVMVQDWLRKCIYDRTGFKSTFGRQLLVFMVSAFWHGFYLGYYISFFFWFAQIYLEAQIFKLTKEKLKSNAQKIVTQINGQKTNKFSQKIKKLLKITIVGLIFGHNAIFFSLLSWKQCFRLLKSMYFIPQLLIILGIIYLSLQKKSIKSKKMGSIEESTKKSQSQTQTEKKSV